MTVKELIASNKNLMLSSLQESIRIRSVQGQPEEGAPYGAGIARALLHAKETAEKLGMRTENVDGHALCCEFGQGEEMVAILAHLDVVPEGEGWSFDPYGGEIADGKIYGRGAMDDKGPAFAALYAMAAVRDSGIPLSRRIRLILGTNEETGSKDMEYYLSHGGETPVMGFTPDGEYPVINGEKGIINACFGASYKQSGPLKLVSIKGGTAPNVVPASAYAEFNCEPDMAQSLLKREKEHIRYILTDKGVKVTAEGVGAHGSTPEQGRNAIGRLILEISGLPLDFKLGNLLGFLAIRMGMETDGESLDIDIWDTASGTLTMNLGVIDGDEESLSLKLNYRYPVTKSYEDCAPKVLDAFKSAGYTLISESHKPSLYIPEDSRLVRTLLSVYRDETGLPACAKSIGGGTYAKAIPNIVAFGPIFPGDEVREHKPDEFIEIDKLVKNAEIFAEAMLRLAR